MSIRSQPPPSAARTLHPSLRGRPLHRLLDSPVIYSSAHPLAECQTPASSRCCRSGHRPEPSGASRARGGGGRDPGGTPAGGQRAAGGGRARTRRVLGGVADALLAGLWGTDLCVLRSGYSGVGGGGLPRKSQGSAWSWGVTSVCGRWRRSPQIALRRRGFGDQIVGSAPLGKATCDGNLGGGQQATSGGGQRAPCPLRASETVWLWGEGPGGASGARPGTRLSLSRTPRTHGRCASPGARPSACAQPLLGLEKGNPVWTTEPETFVRYFK